MNTTTLTFGGPGFWARRTPIDWLFALAILGGAVFAFQRYAGSMDVYEKWIVVGAVPALVWLGWFWSPLRTLALVVGAATLLAITLYSRTTDSFGADLAQADKVFLLKYFVSSQRAILWMCVLFFMSTAFYWIGFFAKTDDNAAQRIGSGMAWTAVARVPMSPIRLRSRSTL